MSPDYFRDNYFFWKFFNNFSVLFLKIFAALRSIVVVTVVTDWAVVLWEKSLFIVNKYFFGRGEINIWLLLTNFSWTKLLTVESNMYNLIPLNIASPYPINDLLTFFFLSVH